LTDELSKARRTVRELKRGEVRHVRRGVRSRQIGKSGILLYLRSTKKRKSLSTGKRVLRGFDQKEDPGYKMERRGREGYRIEKEKV